MSHTNFPELVILLLNVSQNPAELSMSHQREKIKV